MNEGIEAFEGSKRRWLFFGKKYLLYVKADGHGNLPIEKQIRHVNEALVNWLQRRGAKASDMLLSFSTNSLYHDRIIENCKLLLAQEFELTPLSAEAEHDSPALRQQGATRARATAGALASYFPLMTIAKSSPARSGIVSIGKATVPIVSAVISGGIWASGSNWQIDVTGSELDVGGAILKPRLYSEDVGPWSGRKLESIADLFGKTLGDAAWGASLYFTDHIPINDARLTFSEIAGGEAVFKLEGRSDINWNDAFGCRVPILASGRIRIAYVATYGCHDESSARNRLATAISDSAGLIWQPDHDGSHFALRAPNDPSARGKEEPSTS